MKNSTKIAVLLATLMLSFASVMNASVCSVNPSNPACEPTLSLTYQVGLGPLHTLGPVTPTYANGAWNASYTPQTITNPFGTFLFTGGQVISKPDALVGFSFGVINNTNQVMTFNYDFLTPYADGGNGSIETIFGDTLINTNFSGTVAVTTVPPGKFLMNTWDSGSLIAPVRIGLGCVASVVCSSSDQGTIGPMPYTSMGSTGTLEVKGSFTLDPGAQFVITGRSVFAPTPEPGTMALLGSGIVGLAGFARRRFLK